MFKKSDIRAATALLITGYIQDAAPGDLTLLRSGLDAIKEEVADWEENFEMEDVVVFSARGLGLED